MLVKFHSSTSGEVVMFAKDAGHLFAIVGKEGTARGVFTRQQLPDAMTRLHAAVDEDKMAARHALAPPVDQGLEEEAVDDHETPRATAVEAITLAQRAHPLLLLMERTDKENGFILWEASGDF